MKELDAISVILMKYDQSTLIWLYRAPEESEHTVFQAWDELPEKKASAVCTVVTP